MNLFIPAIATKMVLTEPWTFTMYMETRNNKLIGELLRYGWDIRKPERDEEGYYKYAWDARVLGPCTFPAGTWLSVDRIYIRKGQNDYNSISFNMHLDHFDVRTQKKVRIKGRFWVKLADANKIQMEVLPDAPKNP